ncbi:hypothetical protein WI61_11235 [Burkholderia cepacia]|nr:hypothetical protein WI48_17625 [Burkholderia cepacia]KVA58424.1 hypothetical protein WI49_03640 [Burkholderia cepacia]KVA84390.1 hypothetical protein WI51_20115 [Burkholderia cepacia]KVA88002.1 hypothetical protein WI50_13080 [Burkholderia cepacia]KVA90100.1 hypothetical protein WI52_07870 [Burkholderia cepacia]
MCAMGLGGRVWPLCDSVVLGVAVAFGTVGRDIDRLGRLFGRLFYMRHFETLAQPTDEDVFAVPVKLERVPIFERHRHERTALRTFVPLLFPAPHECADALIASVVASGAQLLVNLRCCPPIPFRPA